MIRTRNWLLALLLALSIHVFGFSVFTDDPDDGAEQPGEQGIVIDLGMMGDLGDTVETEAEAEPEPEPEPEPVKQPEPEPEPQSEPEQVKQPEPVKPKQETETKVKQQPKTEPKPVVKPEPEPEPQPVEPPVQKQVSRATTKTDSPAKQAKQKQTSGKASAVSNGGQLAARQSYFSLLAATLAKHKRYPMASRRRGEEGIVKLFFIVDRNGKLLDYRISESSGSRRLDEAVIRMLKKAEPLPAFPDDMIQPQLEVNVPIAFQLDAG